MYPQSVKRPRRGRLRRLVGRALLLLLSVIVVAGGVATALAWRGLGHRASGERRTRMERSPEWHAGHFENPQPLVNDLWGGLVAMRDASPVSAPTAPLSPQNIDPARFASAPASGLRITWMGHSTTLVEIDGVTLLLDPVWSTRPSPLSMIGPARWYPPLIALDKLPRIDAVLISHDHYDHLDQPTVAALSAAGAQFIVPLGIGAHLEYWGVPRARIVELDWWERTKVGALDVVSTPARHASGRMLIDNNATLWNGFAMIGAQHRVYYSGDTGLFPAMREIGAKLGPFDCTLIEIGQYHRAWPDWHIGPEQALEAHAMVRGRVLLPVHWGLFRLAYHGWTEPIERIMAGAAVSGAVVATPAPGESVEPTLPVVTKRWWPTLPWETAVQHPIVSTQMDR
jgi:L-ascorbate metabolism protein UlaG (beta-lactamase superfamily)